MLRGLAELGVAFAELAEAEARRLVSGTKRVGAVLAGMLVVAVVAGATLAIGAGLLVWALFTVYDGLVSRGLALALTGLTVWVVVGGGAWLALSALSRKS